MSNKILGFDAIRALSVTLVILSHVGVVEGSTGALAQFFQVFNAGFGVRAFFVLSGFLITTLLLQEAAVTGTISVPQFFMRRALRIFPLYYLVLFGFFFAHHAGWIGVHKITFIYAATYTYNYVPVDYNAHFLSHLWSLSVEEQFYLIWPLLTLLLLRWPIAQIVMGLTFIAVCAFSMHQGIGARGFVPAAYSILLGAVAAILIFYNDRPRHLMASGGALAVSSVLMASPFYASSSASWLLEIAGGLAVTLAVVWIYLNQHRAAVKSMEWWPVAFIGQISYGLYIWQGVLTGNGPYRAFPHFPPEPWFGALLTFPVAIASFYLFEQPINRLKRYFTPSRTSAIHGGPPSGSECR